MGKLRKHQLLEKAMRDYPAGTRFTSYSEKFEFSYTSTGLFVCWKDKYNTAAHKDSIWRVNEQGEPSGMVYNGLNKEWAEVVKPSILTGRCAVQVNNEREYDLVHQQRETLLGAVNGQSSSAGWSYPIYTEWHKNINQGVKPIDGCVIIPFDKFAEEVGIEVPVFVMTSEDGVPLYVGDDSFVPQWSPGDIYRSVKKFKVAASSKSDESKRFATKEAAEAWIREQNRPRTVEIKLYNMKKALISKDTIIVSEAHCGDIFENETVRLTPSDLEDMLHAYKSLQS